MPRAIVGFDFGTHSTKIVYRLRDEDPLNTARVLRIDGGANVAGGDPTALYPSFAVPSRVCVVDGRVRFGSGTLNPRQDCGPPLKMRLWEEECERDATDGERRQQVLERQRRIHRYGNSRVLAVAYLAWAFRRVSDAIHKQYPDAELEIYMPAPMDHYDYDGPVKRVFLTVMAAAWELAFAPANEAIDLSDGADYQPIADAARRELESLVHQPLPDEGERRFDVLPESLVPLVTLMHDPHFAPGYYLIVDCGGGSTEISVVLRYDSGSAVSCHEDVTYPGGSYQFRAAMNPAADPGLLSRLISELSRNSRSVVQQAFSKVNGIPAAADHFRECLRILLLGGGMLLSDVEDSFFRESKSELIEYLELFGIEERTLYREDLEQVANELGVPYGEARFLMLARGLAIGLGNLPEFFSPAEVPPFPRPALIERRQHWEQ